MTLKIGRKSTIIPVYQQAPQYSSGNTRTGSHFINTSGTRNLLKGGPISPSWSHQYILLMKKDPIRPCSKKVFFSLDKPICLVLSTRKSSPGGPQCGCATAVQIVNQNKNLRAAYPPSIRTHCLVNSSWSTVPRTNYVRKSIRRIRLQQKKGSTSFSRLGKQRRCNLQNTIALFAWLVVT